jgi:hypothetical protein
MSFVKHREYRAGNPTGRANESAIAYGAAHLARMKPNHTTILLDSAACIRRFIFSWVRRLLVFMGVSAMLGAGIGSLGGKFLESKLRMRQ